MVRQQKKYTINNRKNQLKNQSNKSTTSKLAINGKKPNIIANTKKIIDNVTDNITDNVTKTGKTIFDNINDWPGIFPSFKSTNKVFAFTLNALAIGISASIGIFLHDKITKSQLKFFKQNNWVKYIVTGLGALAAAFITYMLMLILFGFGGGMLVNST